MHIAYMDDAGDLGALANPPLHNDQPVFALTLLLVNQVRLAALVPEFLQAFHRPVGSTCVDNSLRCHR
jgi:hypothetical protein